MEKIMNFLKENPTFYFATVEDNKPRVRPFGFVMNYEGRLYFGIGKHKASYKQLISNPNVEISTANKEGKWIRIKGKAVFD
ncbi:pyridoxamine 5'-phosphate oxidase family protein [Clostridioides difficile]